MRRLILLVVSLLVALTLAASPALAHDRDRDCWDEDEFFWVCGRGDLDLDDADFFFVPVFVPVGFWDFDPFWGWFWVDCGYDWGGPLTPADCFD